MIPPFGLMKGSANAIILPTYQLTVEVGSNFKGGYDYGFIDATLNPIQAIGSISPNMYGNRKILQVLESIPGSYIHTESMIIFSGSSPVLFNGIRFEIFNTIYEHPRALFNEYSFGSDILYITNTLTPVGTVGFFNGPLGYNGSGSTSSGNIETILMQIY